MRTIGLRLGGELGEVDARGEPVTDDTMLILLNAHDDVVPFVLPEKPGEGHWEVLVDTYAECPQPGAEAPAQAAGQTFAVGDEYPLAGRSLVVLRHVG
jgi:glycogen operon protein